jgi:ferrous iron transport protein A
MTTLNKLPIGYTGKVISLVSEEKERRRMLDLGFTKGTKITALFSSPFGDPTAYLVRGTIIAIRENDAKRIKITI